MAQVWTLPLRGWSRMALVRNGWAGGQGPAGGWGAAGGAPSHPHSRRRRDRRVAQALRPHVHTRLPRETTAGSVGTAWPHSDAQPPGGGARPSPAGQPWPISRRTPNPPAASCSTSEGWKSRGLRGRGPRSGWAKPPAREQRPAAGSPSAPRQVTEQRSARPEASCPPTLGHLPSGGLGPWSAGSGGCHSLQPLLPLPEASLSALSQVQVHHKEIKEGAPGHTSTTSQGRRLP